jgi:hypothetical protein
MPDSAEMCSSCGKPLRDPAGEVRPGSAPPATSGLATTSLVLGLLGLLTCGLTSIPGLILGIVGLGQINSSGGRLTGKGLAVGGIVSSLAFMVVPLLAIVAAIAIPNLMSSRIASNESAAIAGLRAYTGAQGVFHRQDHYGKGKCVYANPVDGQGFPDLFEVGGEQIKLIDLSMARATSKATPKAGYYFVDLRGAEGAGPYDYSFEFGLCAVPAHYSRTGIYTLVIDTTGTVWKKDTGGVPLDTYPDTSDGWIPVGF